MATPAPTIDTKKATLVAVHQLNMEAICLLRKSQYSMALDFLGQCLSQMEQLAECDYAEEDDDDDDDESCGPDCSCNNARSNGPMAACSLQAIPCTPLKANDACFSSSFVMYSNAFAIVLPEHTSRPLSPAELDQYLEALCEILHGVIVYNMGLACQLTAFYECCGVEQEELYLNQALLAYERVLTEFELFNNMCSSQDEQQTSFLVLELALLNNCGHIYHYYLSASETHHYVQRMEHVLCYQVQHRLMAGNNNNINNPLLSMSGPLECFLRNCAHNRTMQSMAPAA